MLLVFFDFVVMFVQKLRPHVVETSLVHVHLTLCPCRLVLEGVDVVLDPGLAPPCRPYVTAGLSTGGARRTSHMHVLRLCVVRWLKDACAQSRGDAACPRRAWMWCPVLLFAVHLHVPLWAQLCPGLSPYLCPVLDTFFLYDLDNVVIG